MIMIWKILRPRFWELRHQWIGYSLIKKIFSIFGLLAITGITGVIFVTMVFGLFGYNNDDYLISLLPTTIFYLAFFMIIQLGDTLHQLYLSPDLFWINRSPLRKIDIFLTKLVECTFVLWMPGLFSSGLLIALGLSRNVGLLYYPLAAISFLAVVVIITVSGMILVMLLSRMIPPKNLRELIPAALALVSVGGVIIQRLLLNQITQNINFSIEAVDQILFNPPLIIGITSGIVLAAVVGSILGFIIYSSINEDILNSIQAVGEPWVKPDKARGNRLNQFSSLDGLRLLPTDLYPIVYKDWILLKRDPQRLTNLVLMPLMMVFFILPALGVENYSGNGYWLMLFYSVFFTMNSGQANALTAFTLEAQVFGYIFRSPISMLSVMKAKFWSSWIPSAVIWSVVISCGSLVMHFSIWQWVVLTGMVLINLAGNCFVMVGVSARSADLTTINRRPKLTGPMAWLAMLIGFIWNGVIFGLTVSLIFWLAADSILVRGLTANFGINSIPGWILIPVVGLLSGVLCVVAIPMITIWLSGLRRLQKWEQV